MRGGVKKEKIIGGGGLEWKGWKTGRIEKGGEERLEWGKDGGREKGGERGRGEEGEEKTGTAGGGVEQVEWMVCVECVRRSGSGKSPKVVGVK